MNDMVCLKVPTERIYFFILNRIPILINMLMTILYKLLCHSNKLSFQNDYKINHYKRTTRKINPNTDNK